MVARMARRALDAVRGRAGFRSPREEQICMMHEQSTYGTDSARRIPEMIDSQRLLRPCGAHPLARRWLAWDARRETDSLVYIFDGVPDSAKRSLWEALGSMVGVRRPHVVSLDSVGRERGGLIWASASYPGNHEGVLTLGALRVSRGGMFTVFESGRAIEQLLEATACAHGEGVVHGVLGEDGVIVSPRGMLLVEMYGLARALSEGVMSRDEACREEVRSIAEIAWRLLTGTEPADRDVFMPRARRTLDHEWLAWLEQGLEPALGFASAAEALASLPGRSGSGVRVPAGRAKAWLDRISSVVGARRGEPAGHESGEIESDEKRKNTGPSGV